MRIVAMLFAMTGLAGDAGVVALPRHLRNHVLRILRPTESAVRRLVIIAARGVAAPALSPRGRESLFPHLRGQRPSKCPGKASEGAGISKSAPNLALIDPLKRFQFGPVRKKPKAFPRITCIGLSEPTPIPDNWIPSPDDPVSAARLCLRLHALRHALDDLDGQARRLARWREKRDLGLNRSSRFSPMRPGWPPGHRRRRFHEIDDVLRECHSLAVHALREDTS